MMNWLVTAAESLGFDGYWTRLSVEIVGVVCTIVASLKSVAGGVLASYRFVRMASRRLRGQNSEVLQAALDALDYPEAECNESGTKLTCMQVEVLYNDPSDIIPSKAETADGDKKRSLKIELTDTELRVFSRKAKQVIASLNADKIAASRARTAAALRGHNEFSSTGKTSRSSVKADFNPNG